MATWDDVRELALALPDASEHVSRGSAQWKVHAKGFVWERPLRRADLESLGIAQQPGPVLGAKTEDEAVKLALIAEDPTVFFTTPHFDGYAAVLVRLDRISRRRPMPRRPARRAGVARCGRGARARRRSRRSAAW